MTTFHRGGIAGRGPIHQIPISSVHAAAASPQSIRNADRTGAAATAPKHVVAPRVRRTRYADALWCPPWVRKLVTDGASVQDVLREAAKRARGHVAEETLTEVEVLLNELGRDPRHAEALRATVTHDTVAHIMKKGGTAS